VQQTRFQQAVEAANGQLQLIGRVRDPREYASGPADLVETHGQGYVDSIKQAVDLTADAWKAHAIQLERGVDAAPDKARSASRQGA
jgi:hypothetical protein